MTIYKNKSSNIYKRNVSMSHIATETFYLSEHGLAFWQDNNLYEKDFVLLIPSDTDTAFSSKIKEAFFDKLHNRKGVIISGVSADNLLLLYGAYGFAGNIIIASLDLPFGRKLINLLTTGVATEDELVNVILGDM